MSGGVRGASSGARSGGAGPPATSTAVAASGRGTVEYEGVVAWGSSKHGQASPPGFAGGVGRVAAGAQQECAADVERSQVAARAARIHRQCACPSGSSVASRRAAIRTEGVGRITTSVSHEPRVGCHGSFQDDDDTASRIVHAGRP